MIRFRRVTIPVLLTVALVLSLAPAAPADEGMVPVSEIPKMDLRARGLELDPADIIGADRASLVFGIVSVGATGSFVSPEGLFLTNHHVAFGAAQAASTPERDYVRDGFLARTRAEEIEAKGMTARITESFRDVSAEVLRAVKPGQAPEARARAVQQRIKEIVAAAEKAAPGKRAEVSEMFPGKSYMLFLYTHLRDIRLVYVPPRSIGEFGGEDDNWMWPRHTGDFSFLRAYVAPDGSPAAFSKDNVPFKPKRFLTIAPRGVAEGDAVFLLGYPGRTSRHATSHFLAFDEEVRLPEIADWCSRQIAILEDMGAKGGPAIALKHAARIKGLANTMKNYRGKIQGMARVGTVARKREDEKAMQAWIEADPARKTKYGDLLPRFAAVYGEMRGQFAATQFMGAFRSNVNLVSWATTVYEASIERAKPDLQRKPAYMDRNFEQTKRRLALGMANYDGPSDMAVLKALALRFAKSGRVAGVLGAGGLDEASVDARVREMYAATRMDEPDFVAAAWGKTPAELEALNDPFLGIAAKLRPLSAEVETMQDRWNGELESLYARLIDAKAEFLKTGFIPDANSTLRMTIGRVKGYSPRDAVAYRPFTTVRGVAEKTTGRPPYDTPPALLDLVRAGDFGPYRPEGLDSVPACFLYDADTTGGNSGSPVLNARGELIGVNFDRTFEATINDYAWSPEYSRSIGVDIRYVLWVTEKFAKADFLLREMNVGGR